MVVSGTATSFVYLLAARIFLGAVTAASWPAVASLTGDYFPPNVRARTYGMILTGELVGAGIGFFIGGEVSSWFGWRWAFYVMGVPRLFLVLALWLWLHEPARGGQSWIATGQEEVRSEKDVKAGERNLLQRGEEKADELSQPKDATKSQEQALRAGFEPRPQLILDRDPKDRSLWWALRYVLRIPTYVLLIIASALVYHFFGGIRSFGMIYFTSHYHVARSTFSALMIIVGIGAIVGTVGGGWLSERLFNRWGIRMRVVFPGVVLLIAFLCFAPAIYFSNVYAGVALLTGRNGIGISHPHHRRRRPPRHSSSPAVGARRGWPQRAARHT